jgi:hypothetical protein
MHSAVFDAEAEPPPFPDDRRVDRSRMVSVHVAPWPTHPEDPVRPARDRHMECADGLVAPSAANQINNQTLRLIAHVSIGGDRVRIKLSNRYGTAPLVIGAHRWVCARQRVAPTSWPGRAGR